MAASGPHGLLVAMQPALETMRRRQRAMTSTLLAVRTISRKSLRIGPSPDFAQLNRLVGYLERFPDKLHQPAERSALDRWTAGQASAGGELALFSDDYARFCLLHARIEARGVLSVATRVLTPADWIAVERAYAQANDPLERSTGRSDCEAALRNIA